MDEVGWQMQSGERVASHVSVVEAVAAPDVVQFVAASQAPVVVSSGGQPVCFPCGVGAAHLTSSSHSMYSLMSVSRQSVTRCGFVCV